MIPQFANKEDFWNTPLKARPGKTARALMDDGLGDPEYSFEKYVSGAYGDRITEYFKTYALYEGDDMNEDVLNYWRGYGKGLEKHFHDDADPFRQWCAYIPCSAELPENRERKYPCIVIGQRIHTMMLYEASSFIHMAAENEIVILTGRDVNEDENFENMLDTALQLYPIDESRIYLHGHSFGAVLSGRHAVKYARRIAGVCMSGSQYYGADSSAEETALARKLRMPLIAIHCTNQSRNLLPYNVTPRRQMSPKNRMNVTTSDFTLLTGYEEVRFWRDINHCGEVSLENMRHIQETSEDVCEKVLGIELDRTHVEQREGVSHYFGDILDDNGTVMLRYVAVEGGPHAVPPHAGTIAWDFLKDFSRDPATGALLRSGKAAGEGDPFWTTAYPAIAYRTPREYLASHGDASFRFGDFFSAEVTEHVRKALESRLRFTGGELGLAQYWERPGIRRQLFREGGKEWTLYLPEGRTERRPLVMYLGDTENILDGEASGFVQAAAARGMMTAIPSDVNDDALIGRIIADLKECGLLAERQVFIAGFGFGAVCGGRHAVRLAGETAGVCLMGDQYYGYDNTPEEIEEARQRGLPVIMIHGTREERGILPLYADSPCPLPPRRADHVTISTFSLISSYSEDLFWRQLNGCDTVTLKEMAETQESENEVIRTIGATADETAITEKDGIRVFSAKVKNPKGQAVMCYTALCGAPHAALPAAAEIACDFFSSIPV